MKRRKAAGLHIDVVVDSDRWQDAGAAKAVVRRALKQAATALSTKSAGLAIVLTDDAAMRRLNRNWRGIDAPTNVLSFAAKYPRDRHKRDRLDDGRIADHLGDIVLAYETLKREARREGKLLDHHLAHLAVHGFLHLLGYDHESDAQARRMEATERAILRNLAVPDPYAATPSTVTHTRPRAAKRPPSGRARRAERVKSLVRSCSR
jgi:probable rRNA maturation factor